jgi:hypothetical protein
MDLVGFVTWLLIGIAVLTIVVGIMRGPSKSFTKLKQTARRINFK